MAGLFIALAVFVVVVEAIAVTRKKDISGKQQSSRSVQKVIYSGGYQIPKKAFWNKASAKIRREADRIDDLNEWHENLPYTACKYSYTTEDPMFDFNGYNTVDEFVELRRRAKAHEAHLRARVSNL